MAVGLITKTNNYFHFCLCIVLLYESDFHQ